MRRWQRRGLIALALFLLLLAGMGGLVYYLTHYVDAYRIVYKRWKEPDPYIFEKVDPSFLKTDPSRLIAVRAPADVARVRAALTAVVFGVPDLPTDLRPVSVEAGPIPPRFAHIGGIAGFERLEVPIDLGYAAAAYHLLPSSPNGRLVVYQHGYAGTVDQAGDLLSPLLAAGYGVLAVNYPGYGENDMSTVDLPRFGRYPINHDRIVYVHPQPMRFYVEPVVAGLNHLLASGRYRRADMVGFSAGGWVATIVAAIDPRIRTAFTVAGGYPIYLRAGYHENQSAPPQYFQPLLQAANYLEMYVLAASGDGRQLIQLFNRYDRCCFRNTLGRLYEPAVKEAVSQIGQGGTFRVLIDETHADHRISTWARQHLMAALEAAARQ